MLSSALTTRKLRVRSGVTAARSRSAGRSSRAVGSAARVNGRIWSRMIGVVSVRNGRVSRSDGPSARALPAQRLERRPQHGGHRAGLGQRLLRDVERRRQLPQRRADVRLLVRQRREHGVRVLDEVGELSVLGAELLHQQREVVDRALEVLAAQRELLVRLARVAGGRLEAADRPRQRAAVAVEPLGGVAEQQPQVVARVGVERGEDLVEVDVRERLRGRDPLALGQLAGLGVPGVSSATMSLRPVFGRSRIVASR